MSRPLYKDISFWIVAIVLVGTVDVVQLYFGLPWLKGKIAEVQPAPRVNNPSQIASGLNISGLNQPVNLDNSKKTYPWQAPRPDPRLLQDASPQVVVIPTEYQPPSGGWSMSQSNAAIGVRVSAENLVMAAYNWRSRPRLLLVDPMPAGQFDYIAKQPDGALEALQAEIKRKLNLVVERQTVLTNVLVLRRDHDNAPGLTPSTGVPTTPRQNQPGVLSLPRQKMSAVLPFFESMLRQPVIDETGLTGIYDIQLPTIRMQPGQAGNMLEEEKKIFLDQLGLALIETNAPVEMLFVRKSN